MLRVAVPCANLFHEEVEGDDAPILSTSRTVADRAELDDLLARKVQIHGRCYCGHVTQVSGTNALLVAEDADAAPGAPDPNEPGPAAEG